MATKTNGIEFKKFYDDKSVWPEGAYHDEAVIMVDGEDATDTDLSLVPDSARVVIESGWVFVPDQDDAIPLETYFKRWRKSQTLRSLVVEVDVAKLDAVIAAIKAAGGKVR